MQSQAGPAITGAPTRFEADIPADIPPLPAHRLPLAELRALADLEGP